MAKEDQTHKCHDTISGGADNNGFEALLDLLQRKLRKRSHKKTWRVNDIGKDLEYFGLELCMHPLIFCPPLHHCWLKFQYYTFLQNLTSLLMELCNVFLLATGYKG